MLREYRCQYRGLNRRSTATSLISCTLILIATLLQCQYATVTAQATTSAAATTRQTTGFANPAKYDDEATQNYYRIRAGDSNEQMAATRAAAAASAATYANYLAASANYNRPQEQEEEVSATLITRDNLAALQTAAGTNSGFMPTTPTAAGQHYAEAAATKTTTANNDYALLLGEESFKLPTGDKIDYDKINSDSYERARDSISTTSEDEAFAAAYAQYQQQQQHQQRQQQQQQQQKEHFGQIDDELRDYFAYQAKNDEPQQHYLHDYQREQFSNYQQHDAPNYALNANSKQQQQNLRLAAIASTPTTEQYEELSFATQHQFHKPAEKQQNQQYQHQITASSQRQVQVTDSKGRSLLPPSISGATVADDINNDSARSSSLYYYQNHELPKPLSNDLELTSNHQLDSDLQHMQHQLQQQQKHFAQLQLQLQQHDIQLQQQHYHPPPPLPPPTSTIHHTAASAAAIAGIPLGKHIHDIKQIPFLHYQQQLVPFKQKVSIDIPRPVITTVPRPYPIQIPMPKTIAVTQMKEIKIPIEKIKPFPVERSVPYIVERHVPYRVEKQVAKPYYFPYPIKVPVLKTIVHRAPKTSTNFHLHPQLHQHHPQLHFQPHGKPHMLHNLAGLY